MVETLTLLGGLAVLWVAGYLVVTQIFNVEPGGRVELGPLYLMVRSSSLNDLFKGWTERHRRAVNVFYIVGIIVAVVALVVSIGFLADQVRQQFFIPEGPSTPGVVVIIPFVTVTGVTLLRMLPAFGLVLITHEFSHKIAAHAEDLPVKSVGLALFLFLPGAFVEPDEEKFKTSEPSTRMKVLAAGSFINIITGLLFIPAAFPGTPYSPYAGPSGVVVEGLTPGGPLAMTDALPPGSVIVGLDDHEVRTLSELAQLDIAPDEEVTVRFHRPGDVYGQEPRSVNIVAAAHPDDPESGIIGVRLNGVPFFAGKMPLLPIGQSNFLWWVNFWVFAIAIGVGMFNMLPIWPLDGFNFLGALMERFDVKERIRKPVLYASMSVALLLVVLSIAPNFPGML